MDPLSNQNEPPTPSAERLRRALDPPSGMAERVAAAALHPAKREEPSSGWRSSRLLAALGSITALASLLGLVAELLPQRPDRPAVSAPELPRVSISNQGGVLLARRAGEPGGWIVRSDASSSEPSSQIVIVRHGDF